jgi:flagellum-specific peptidoglycan hydrolase FlgJ
MHKKTNLFLAILVVAITAVSCGSGKSVVTRKKKSATTTKSAQPKPKPVARTMPKEKDKVTEAIKTRSGDKAALYVANFASVAMAEMKLYKIPASIKLAQGILESGSGEGRLAVEANNHFGIKCHKGWTGGEIYHDDDELQECFRTYNDASYSYRDHSLFLMDRSRYAGLFKLPADDYVAWANGLRRAGYATDPRYPEKLISLIERYELYKYDATVLGKEPQLRQQTTTALAYEQGKTHAVIKGDTLYNISKRYGLTVDDLKQYNNMSSNDISLGQMLFIKKQ